jgi:hypothetical protein
MEILYAENQINHIEVFCALNAMLLNFSPRQTQDYNSLLNKVKIQINKHKHMYNVCVQQAGVIPEDKSILTGMDAVSG